MEVVELTEVSPASLKRLKTNTKELVVLGNFAVSMLDLELASRVPTRTRDDDTRKLFKSSLTLSKSFTLFTFIIPGKYLPIEKVSGDSRCQIILHSAFSWQLLRTT